MYVSDKQIITDLRRLSKFDFLRIDVLNKNKYKGVQLKSHRNRLYAFFVTFSLIYI